MVCTVAGGSWVCVGVGGCPFSFFSSTTLFPNPSLFLVPGPQEPSPRVGERTRQEGRGGVAEEGGGVDLQSIHLMDQNMAETLKVLVEGLECAGCAFRHPSIETCIFLACQEQILNYQIDQNHTCPQGAHAFPCLPDPYYRILLPLLPLEGR